MQCDNCTFEQIIQCGGAWHLIECRAQDVERLDTCGDPACRPLRFLLWIVVVLRVLMFWHGRTWLVRDYSDRSIGLPLPKMRLRWQCNESIVPGKPYQDAVDKMTR